MPRKNKTIRHKRYDASSFRAPQKRRFNSKQEAKNAIIELQKYNLDLKLYVYQSPIDGGWYLTSKEC